MHTFQEKYPRMQPVSGHIQFYDGFRNLAPGHVPGSRTASLCCYILLNGDFKCKAKTKEMTMKNIYSIPPLLLSITADKTNQSELEIISCNHCQA